MRILSTLLSLIKIMHYICEQKINVALLHAVDHNDTNTLSVMLIELLY